MRKIAIAVMFFGTSAGLCQTPAKEPDALQALLTEVHHLRQDIEAVTVASQAAYADRTSYSLQMQDCRPWPAQRRGWIPSGVSARPRRRNATILSRKFNGGRLRGLAAPCQPTMSRTIAHC